MVMGSCVHSIITLIHSLLRLTKTLLFLFRGFLILYPESSGSLASDWSPVENGELELFLP